MGAEYFTTVAEGDTAEEAFNAAVEDAQYDYGHAGYTGTIAEKGEFIMIKCPEDMDPHEYAETDEAMDQVNDKWGPAGCIALGEGKWLFFGWASS